MVAASSTRTADSSIVAILAASARARAETAGTFPCGRHRLALVMALAAFDLGSAVTLNDGNEMRKFPFEPLILEAVEMVRHPAAAGAMR